ncbi:uncharacterized protein F4807DRAFT_378206 [Annulohypoxylon truncatum]|uniref:uncharacterized protein n=1 Tax=Annulohypoxylon truncatum TaxID=327061 RepID=UPI002007C965|nr:uncharacterized protein F4807DRAFT_378206 [Annulohypoxylon truncatum]KAI1211831.1 hypothetical protein F4807DRAFT_378206 [Annulohypoxylon truncatum]
MKGASRLDKKRIASRLTFWDFLRRWCFHFRSSNTLFTRLDTYSTSSERASGSTLLCLPLSYYFLHFVTERYLSSWPCLSYSFVSLKSKKHHASWAIIKPDSMTSKTLGAEANSYISEMICPPPEPLCVFTTDPSLTWCGRLLELWVLVDVVSLGTCDDQGSNLTHGGWPKSLRCGNLFNEYDVNDYVL